MLSRCPNCGNHIDDEARACPSCRWDFETFTIPPPKAGEASGSALSPGTQREEPPAAPMRSNASPYGPQDGDASAPPRGPVEGLRLRQWEPLQPSAGPPASAPPPGIPPRPAADAAERFRKPKAPPAGPEKPAGRLAAIRKRRNLIPWIILIGAAVGLGAMIYAYLSVSPELPIDTLQWIHAPARRAPETK